MTVHLISIQINFIKLTAIRLLLEFWANKKRKIESGLQVMSLVTIENVLSDIIDYLFLEPKLTLFMFKI